ncbi:MAG TPA: DUF2855 family protein [Kofleriaceae bacterium]|nr:DUF2855 family protein [Kofleriaceae bacterium]
MLSFVVDRGDLRRCAFLDLHAPVLEMGQVRLRVERFAFTANNVTYATLGEAMSYWQFFPVSDGWGRIPVWGYGEVAASRHADIAAGQRFYGYLPMSTHVVVTPGAVSPQGFADATPCRAPLPAIYNRYVRCAPDADRRSEDRHALLRPLLATSFLLADYLADQGFFGARAVVVSSASSKTALGTAMLLSAGGACQVIGLTSPGRVGFLETLGCYHRVIPYDRVDQLPGDRPAIFVDFASRPELRRAVHEQLGDRLVYSSFVGATHAPSAGRAGADAGLPGPAPVLFFAPTQIDRRAQEWGLAALMERLGAEVRRLSDSMSSWLRVVESSGREAVERVYREVLEGRSRSDEGHILAL